MDKLMVSTVTACHLILYFREWTLFRVHRLCWARSCSHANMLRMSSFSSAVLLWRAVDPAITQMRWAGAFETMSSDTQPGLLLRNYNPDYRRTSQMHRGPKTLQESFAN